MQDQAVLKQQPLHIDSAAGELRMILKLEHLRA